ncbi:MAG: hypothetical protein HYY62_06765 [Deltaproteobacteria bacterium]|nr:hypothetical protein [Deltaproteobacteria bacterium]
MKSLWWRIGLIVIAILIGAYFTLKHVGLYLVRPLLEKELSEVTKLDIRIGSLYYSILGRSFSVREFKVKDRKKRVLVHLNRARVAIKVSLFHPFTLPIELQADFPEKGRLDFSAAYGIRTQTLDGKFQLNHYALMNMKDLLQDRFALAPKDGIIYLNSDFKLYGTKLRSFHRIKVENFNYAPLQSAVSVIGGAALLGPLGLAGGMLDALTRKHKGNLAFDFRLDGDLADKNFDWNKVVSAAVSKAFQNALQGSSILP